MSINRVVFFSYRTADSALELYRFISPLKAAGIELVEGVCEREPCIERITGADLVCFQRDFSRQFSNYQWVLSEAREKRIPVVLDLDDHLLAFPTNHPDRLAGDFADSLPALLHAMLSVDALTVTTPELKQELSAFNPNISVLPNYLDADLWQFRSPVLRGREEPVRILFMGTPTHAPDLESIEEPLLNTARRYGKQVHFIFFGAKAPAGLEDFAQVDYQPVKTYDYQLFQEELYGIDADIAISPLVGNTFNRCKSAIKYFEYSARGFAGVYTALNPYTSVVEDGQNGFLAANEQEWERKLEALIEDPQLRYEVAQRAQEDVQKHWLVQNHAQEWRRAYKEIVSRGIRQKMPPDAITKALASTALQLEELRILTARRNVTLQNEEIQIRDQHIRALEAEIDSLRDEAVGYATSRSWQLTRPLRVVDRFFSRLRGQ